MSQSTERSLLALLSLIACASVPLVQAAVPGSAEPQADGAHEAGAPHFDLLEFEVAGNTVLTPLEIEKAVYPFLGPDKSIKEVEAARTALENLYHKRGYLTVFVDIPEQQVQEGVVRLRVTEGKVEGLRITGNRYFSRGSIRAKVPGLEPGTVPNFPEVQKQLAELTPSPDRQVTPVLRAGKAPGTVDVELKVDDKLPLHGSVELNNNNSMDTEPLRAQATLRYDNLWQRGHSISALVQTAPQDPQQSQVYAGTYVMPILTPGNSLAFYGVSSNSNVASVGGTTVIGNGYILGARGVFPLPSQGAYSQTFTAGVDYKSFNDSVQFGGENIETPVSYVPFVLQYGASYVKEKSLTHGSVALNFSPRGIWVNDDAEFDTKRFKALQSYVYLRGTLDNAMALSPKFRLVSRFSGQLASQALISNEQFAAGGFDSVRGYYEAERLGDDAIQGSIQVNYSPWPGLQGKLNELVVFGFVDGAALWVIDALPGQESQFDLASVGLGVGLRAWQSLDASLNVAFPLINGVQTQRGDMRVLFKVAYGF